MLNLTLRQLRYFDALARHSHFGRAAESCSISQPALSMQIKELEEALGGLLLERSARQVALTRFGEELAQRVRDILRSVDELGDFARASQDRFSGRLRIGMIPTIAPYLLPTITKNLTRMHPELDIRVRETMTPRLIQELVEGRLDTAIVALPVSEPSLTEVALFEEKFLLVRPSADEGTPGTVAGDDARDAAAVARRGALLPRSGAVILQHAIGAATRDAGCQFAVDAGPDGQRRHRRHVDPRDGGVS
ncbi:DNA-binding transcriptional LysR family regulator [Bradyrhizobium sp. GM22.5]